LSADATTARGREAAGAAAARAPRRAMQSPAAVVVFVLLTAATLAGDLWSKHAAFDSLLSDPALQARAETYLDIAGPRATPEAVLHTYTRPVAPGVHFTLSLNPGVAFGWRIPRLLVGAATVVTVAAACWFFATAPAGAWLLHVGLAMLLGGALGNFYDRLLAEVTVPPFEPIRHHVRDFIDCSGLYYPWVFNLADAWLVIGVALLVIHWWRAGRPQRNAGEADNA